MISVLRKPLVVLGIVFGCLAFWSANAWAATFTVTNALDSGPGSLRDAITRANATPAADLIRFAIPEFDYPGLAYHTISLTTALPAISAAVTIDGRTEPPFAGTPLIRIDDGCGCIQSAFDVHAPGTKIYGLSLTRFTGATVSLESAASQSVIAGNWIGLRQDSTTAGNVAGIVVMSSHNVIGGATAGARNIISGNSGSGVVLFEPTATKNVVAGNYIGLTPNGDNASGNALEGVVVGAGANGNTIGGTTPSARNVISGNRDAGVLFEDSGTSGNLLEGNFIGTNATGAEALGNVHSGVVLGNGAAGNTVGGTSAGARNIISGNGSEGIDVASDKNVIAGNDIGSTADGTAPLGNNDDGIFVEGLASHNTIGGTATGAGNLIAGNTVNGVAFTGGVTANVVAGNVIGVTRTGAVLPNGCDGVLLTADGNTVGGTVPSARNIISGNGTGATVCGNAGNGVELTGANSNLVAGNYIGTNLMGLAGLGNYSAGVEIDSGSQNNVIGGVVPGARNIISGNGYGSGSTSGVDVTDSGTSANVVEGNYLGTDATGMASIPNAEAGITLEPTASDNTVGGMVTGARNVISGNGDDGMDLYGSNSLIIGNFIGTNASGTAALPNRCDGIYAFLATGNQIGGGLPGTGNVISGNGAPGGCDGYAYGLELVNVVNTGVFGNKIGTSASGTTALGNLGGGIALEGNAHGTSIGAPRASNVISGNKDDGIDIFGSAYDNAVVDNLVGTNAAGTGPLGNANFGVYVNSNGSGNSIGDPSDTNVIAFNGATTQAEGVRIDGATGVTISGNSIFSNGGLGIALVNNGNHYQPAPVITGVAPTPGGTNVSGTFSDSSEPNEFITIQLFANAKCDPSTYGEGQKLIASFTEETDASGNISWADKVTPALSSSMKIVTATATRVSNGDTSRFSGCKS